MIPYFSFEYFSVGPAKVYVWGLLVGLGFSAGYIFALIKAKKRGLDETKIMWLSVLIFVGAMLGSRLLFLLQTPGRFSGNFSLLWQFNGGAMLYGGLLGGIYFGWLYLKKINWDFWEIADTLAPAGALGIAIGRIGCALINDHMGAYTSMPWGILWTDGVARHPVAIYESLFCFALFFALLYFQGKLKPGRLFLIFLLFYSVGRFLLDFFREPTVDPHFYWSMSQWVSVLLILFVIYRFWADKRQKI